MKHKNLKKPLRVGGAKLSTKPSKKQQGYVMALAAILLGVMGMSMVGLHNSGELTVHKQRQQNAADAVVFSNANLAARDLNVMAYLNRAMVANQAAVGQAVGLVSWSNMIYISARNLDYVGTLFAWIPFVKSATEIILAIAEGLQTGVDGLFGEWFFSMHDGLIGLYSGAQEGIHIAMLGSIPSLFNEVLSKNDPDIDLGFLSTINTAAEYVSRLDDTIDRIEDKDVSSDEDGDIKRFDEFANVVRDSRDGFTANRSYNWLPTITIFPFKMNVRKYGASEFERSELDGEYVWEWNAMDTVGISTRVWKGWRGWKRSGKFSMPIGWGAAHVLNGNRSDDRYAYEDSSSTNRWRGAWNHYFAGWGAVSEYGDENRGETSGLRDFYDIKKDIDTLKDDGMEFLGPAMMVVLKKPLNKVQTWKRMLESEGGQTGVRTDIEETVKETHMYVASKAEPYYSRATDVSHFMRGDGRREYGNLYNPYWQPRLVKLSNADRAKAVVLSAIE